MTPLVMPIEIAVGPHVSGFLPFDFEHELFAAFLNIRRDRRFTNAARRHSALDYLSPTQFEKLASGWANASPLFRGKSMPSRAAREGAATVVMSPRRL